MIREFKSGKYRLYSRKKDKKTGKRRNLGTFATREAAEKHERQVQYFKRHQERDAIKIRKFHSVTAMAARI